MKALHYCSSMGALMVVALLTSGALGGEVYAHDVEVAVGNVPENILQAAKAVFPGKFSKYVSAEKRTIDKKVVHYSIELKLKDKTSVDTYFSEDAKLLRTGVAVDAANVPEAVRTAFQKAYGDWKVTDLNKETDAVTKVEVYSVDINKGGKMLEVDFSPDGTVVKTLELRDND